MHFLKTGQQVAFNSDERLKSEQNTNTREGSAGWRFPRVARLSSLAPACEFCWLYCPSLKLETLGANWKIEWNAFIFVY